jgi:hypothetical protein
MSTRKPFLLVEFRLIVTVSAALLALALALAPVPGSAWNADDRPYYIFDTHLHTTPEGYAQHQGDLAFEVWADDAGTLLHKVAEQGDASDQLGFIGRWIGGEYRTGQTFRPSAGGQLRVVRVWLQRSLEAPQDLRVGVRIARVDQDTFNPLEIMGEALIANVSTVAGPHDAWFLMAPALEEGEEYAVLVQCEDAGSLPGKPVFVFGSFGNPYGAGQRVAGREGDLWRPADLGCFTGDFATCFASWDVARIFGSWRSIPNHCTNLGYLDANVTGVPQSNIRRALMISSSRARYPHDELSLCEQTEGTYGVVDAADGSVDERELEAAQAELTECVGPGSYKRFFPTMNGFSMEVEQSPSDVDYMEVLREILYDEVENEDGIRWVGEMLDDCSTDQMTPPGGVGPTQRVKDILSILGKRGAPLSAHLPTFGIRKRAYLRNGNSCVEDDYACKNFVALLTAAGRRGATIHESVGHMALLKEDGWYDGTNEAFYSSIFERFPNYVIELFAVERTTVLNVPYDPANLADLPEWFLDFMITHSNRFTIGSHMYPQVDFTPGDKYGGPTMAGWTGYWDEFFSQLAARPGGWAAMLNISHCNVERLLDVGPAPGFLCPAVE